MLSTAPCQASRGLANISGGACLVLRFSRWHAVFAVPLQLLLYCCRFHHLVAYGGCYYSYIYADSLAGSIWSRYCSDSPLSRETGGRAQLWAADAPAHQLEGLLLLQVMQSGPSCSSLVLRNIHWTLWKACWAETHCCSLEKATTGAMHPAGKGSSDSMACAADHTVQPCLINLMIRVTTF